MTDDTKPSATAALAADSENRVRTAIEIAVRLGVVLLLVGWCLQIVAPFIGILVWALVIAIGSTTPYEKLVSLLGGRRGLAAAVTVLAGLLVLIVPAVLLSETLVSGAQYFADDVAEGRVTVPPPPGKVAVPPPGSPSPHTSASTTIAEPFSAAAPTSRRAKASGALSALAPPNTTTAS